MSTAFSANLATKACPEAFATEVVDFELGPGVEPAFGDVMNALGAPDFVEGKNAVSLGNQTGSTAWIELAFDVPIRDGKGPDLHIYERGPAAEPTAVELSYDGKTWFHVGEVAGSVRQFDIGANPELVGKSFRFLRLQALRSNAAAPWAGPDIDAVGVLNSCTMPNS